MGIGRLGGSVLEKPESNGKYAFALLSQIVWEWSLAAGWSSVVRAPLLGFTISLSKTLPKISFSKILSMSYCITAENAYDMFVSTRLINYLTNWRQVFMRLSCYWSWIHNIVKVAVDLRGDTRVDPQTTLTMLRRNSLSITGQTHYVKKLTSIGFLR